MNDCLQMTWIDWLLADEINWIHEMIVAIYVILLNYKTWKHDADCADNDTAGEGDGSPQASGGSDQREETYRRYAI